MGYLEDVLTTTSIGAAFISFSASFIAYAKIMIEYLEGCLRKKEDSEKKFRDMRNGSIIGFGAYYCSIPGRYLAYRDFELH